MTDEDLDDLLAAYHDNVPGMTDDAFRTGRARLRRATEPAAVTPQWTHEPPVRAVEVRSGARRSPPLAWLAAAAAVGVLVVGSVFVLRSGRDIPTTVGTPSSVVLDRLAHNASDLPQAPGQFLRMTRHEYSDAGFTYAVPGEGAKVADGPNEGIWTEWVPADRTGVWQLSRDTHLGVPDAEWPGSPPTPSKVSGLSAEEGVFRAPGGDYYPMWDPTTELMTGPSESSIAALPRDPAELLKHLTTVATEYNNRLTTVATVLSRPIPLDLRKALFTVLKDLDPKVEEDARTRDGRSAIAISSPEHNFTQTIYVDPTNGLLLGSKLTAHGSLVLETTTTWTVVGAMGAES